MHIRVLSVLKKICSENLEERSVLQTATSATRLDRPYGIRKWEMKLANFDRGDSRACAS